MLIASVRWRVRLSAPRLLLPYIESTSGVAVGGRAGLTAVVVGVMFLLVMFFSPLVAMVPPTQPPGVNLCWRADDFEPGAR
ncbi:hypothetical protein O5558_03370 [Escherichia coli]|nr:hypothetical protein [Escherichia coli]